MAFIFITQTEERSKDKEKKSQKMIIKIMMWLVVAVALAGAFLNTRGKWQGFLLWLISNAWWCWYNIIAGEYPQVFLFGVFWFISLYGIFQWRKIQREIKNYKQAVKDFGQTRTNERELTNKQLALLLEENTYLRNILQGMPYHKKAKKRLRINIPTTTKQKDKDYGEERKKQKQKTGKRGRGVSEDKFGNQNQGRGFR